MVTPSFKNHVLVEKMTHTDINTHNQQINLVDIYSVWCAVQKVKSEHFC